MSLSTLATNLLVETSKNYAKNILGIKVSSVLSAEVMPEFVELGWEFHPDFNEMCVDVVLEYKDNNGELFAVSMTVTDNYEVVDTDSFGITYDYD